MYVLSKKTSYWGNSWLCENHPRNHESRVANYSNKQFCSNLTTDNLCTVYPIMRAVAFDPSGLQGLLFDLTLIDPLRRPSKDKTFCQYPLRQKTLLKKSDFGMIVKRHSRSKSLWPLSNGILPVVICSGIFPYARIRTSWKRNSEQIRVGA